KLSNLVVGGGVWMNTQRPEWNDANNALVGWGLSVVTAAHLHRYCAVVAELLAGAGPDLSLSAEVATWLDRVRAALSAEAPHLAAGPADDLARGRVLGAVGRAFGDHRAALYRAGLSAPVARATADVVAVLDLARRFCAQTVRDNRRADGLYHGYNVMVPRDGGAAIGLERLPLMLEGQVAVLDSGVLSAVEAADLLDALFASDLYRPDQRSFVLYPPPARPAFLDRNAVPAADAEAIPLLAGLLEAGDRRVVARDAAGRVRFAGDLANADDLAAALDALAATEPALAARVAADRDAVLALWERVFHHRTYPGRAATMHAYEGIGSIYWHMVSKLQLAAAEAFAAARGDDALR
ncbi:MAG: hypothetical protein KC635_14130, partial [Myxococcales bacterium]|nr:hypothetical protein [Myxococcales bacterium]